MESKSPPQIAGTMPPILDPREKKPANLNFLLIPAGQHQQHTGQGRSGALLVISMVYQRSATEKEAARRKGTPLLIGQNQTHQACTGRL